MIGEKIKKLDFMAPPVSLNVNGSNGIKTYFGLSMSIGYLASIIVLGGIIIQGYFDTKSPSVAQEFSESGTYPEISLLENGLFPVSYVYYQEVNPIPAVLMAKYFTIKLFKYSYTSYLDSAGSPQVDFKVDYMDVVPCSEIKQNETDYSYYKQYEETPYFKQYGMDLGMCIRVKPELMKVKGGGSDSSLEILAYIFYPCSLPSGCATKAEMDDIGVVYSFPSSSMNLSNYEQPVKSYLNADNFLFVNTAARQKFQGKLSVTEIYDDPGMYFPLSLRHNSSALDRIIPASRFRNDSQVQCTVQEMVSDACKSYLVFDYMSSGKKLKVVRQFKGIVQTISDIGGINSIIFLLFLWTNLVYVECIQEKVLVNKVFDFFSEKLFAAKKSASSEKCSLCLCKKKDKKTQVQAKDSGSLRSMRSVVSKDDPGALEPVVVARLQTEAYKMIEKSLDVVTLVKEINSLKVLTHLLLKDYHLKLVPLISLSLQCSKSGVDLLGPEFSDGTENITKHKSMDEFSSLGFKRLGFPTALEKLRKRESIIDQKGKVVDVEDLVHGEEIIKKKCVCGENCSNKEDLDGRIDRFCLDSLSKGQMVFSELLKINRSSLHKTSVGSSEVQIGSDGAIDNDEFMLRKQPNEESPIMGHQNLNSINPNDKIDSFLESDKKSESKKNIMKPSPMLNKKAIAARSKSIGQPKKIL